VRSVFHYFPITARLASVKCHQLSVLGLTRGSLGSLVFKSKTHKLAAFLRFSRFSNGFQLEQRWLWVVCPVGPITGGALRPSSLRLRILIGHQGEVGKLIGIYQPQPTEFTEEIRYGPGSLVSKLNNPLLRFAWASSSDANKQWTFVASSSAMLLQDRGECSTAPLFDTVTTSKPSSCL